MFRKLQWKLTLLHTMILVLILGMLNVSAFYILQSFNESQLANETARMLEVLDETAWLQVSHEEEVPATIQLHPSPDSPPSTAEPDETSKHETNGFGDEETDSDGKDVDDVGDDADDSDDDASDDDADDSDDDASDDDADASIGGFDGPGPLVFPALARSWNTAGRQTAARGVMLPISRTTAQQMPLHVPLSTAASAKADSPTLHVPPLLKRFSAYLVFDTQGNVVAHNIVNRQMLDAILELLPAVPMDTFPRVQELPVDPPVRYLLAKRPIVIEGVSHGSYLVGRDLGLVSDTMANLRNILLLSFGLGALLSLLAGYLLAGRAIRPIRAAYEKKQRFLADASHELRTPISVVLLSAESMERALLPGQEEARADLTDIREETYRMRDLVERLLFLARHDSLKKTHVFEPVDLKALLNNVMHTLHVPAGAKGVTMELRSPDALTCSGDEKMLASLFTVLVENAIKYNRANGQVILEASVKIRGKKCWAVVHVRDTGIGIPETEQPLIFQRFYRADPSRSQKTGGHGLGLAIAKEMAEAHGGTIEVASQPDIGTTFTVYLPVSPHPSTKSHRRTPH